MDLDARVWREAAVTADVGSFIARIGGSLLDDLGLDLVAITLLAHRQLETVTSMHRGQTGSPRPSVRSELGEAAAARLNRWIRAGRPDRADRGSANAAARDLVEHLGSLDDGRWWMIPLGAHSDYQGALVVLGPKGSTLDGRRFAMIAEAIEVVAGKEIAHRELSRLREAADAERATAQANTRDIGAAVIGAQTGLREVMKQVEQVAPTPAPVLIFGETGAGKDVVARAIHERSMRSEGPILRVNCGAIPPELIDSELFGHERGSFSGAVAQRPGWFERADGGTLFLDEIAELPLAAQVRLLRVVQDGVFERVGGTRSLQVDVRVVAATHRDLSAMVERGTFRADLWYRINVFTINLPPLRARQNDIPALAMHFAQTATRRLGADPLPLTPSDLEMLLAYEWPGNVRELAAVIERAAILGEGGRLDIQRALGAAAGEHMGFPSLNASIREHIERALLRCRGRIDGPRGAASLLEVNPNTLRSKMQKLGIAATAFRPDQP